MMNTLIPTDPAPTLEDIWRLFRETDRQQKENALQIREMSRETDRQIKEMSKETNRQIKAVNKKIGELGNRLGEFVEEMIKPSVVRLFQERGIDIHSVMRNVETNNPQLNLAMQIDLLVVNNGSCVLVEVKSNLSQDDIEEHLERMEKFKTLFPIYKDYKVLGAVAGMVIPENIARYAYKKGFFVIAQKGDSAVILNDNKFQPTTW
jgi:hypothetical protein